ncbi:MAG: hypothetical protein Q9182_004513 [Xanthomendoza sp. 2 TL-2023]
MADQVAVASVIPSFDFPPDYPGYDIILREAQLYYGETNPPFTSKYSRFQAPKERETVLAGPGGRCPARITPNLLITVTNRIWNSQTTFWTVDYKDQRFIVKCIGGAGYKRWLSSARKELVLDLLSKNLFYEMLGQEREHYRNRPKACPFLMKKDESQSRKIWKAEIPAVLADQDGQQTDEQCLLRQRAWNASFVYLVATASAYPYRQRIVVRYPEGPYVSLTTEKRQILTRKRHSAQQWNSPGDQMRTAERNMASDDTLRVAAQMAIDSLFVDTVTNPIRTRTEPVIQTSIVPDRDPNAPVYSRMVHL